MSTWIKAGFWEQLCKPCQGYKGWLNLTKFVEDLAVPGPPGPEGPQGPPGPVGGGLFAQTANSTIITGTTAESSLINGGVGSLSIPANGFTVGDSFRAEFGGLLSSKNNDTIRIRIKAGSVVLADSGPQTMNTATNDVWELSASFTVRQTGVAGVASIVTLGVFHTTKQSNGAQTGFAFNTVNNTTFDTTVPNILNVTVQFSSNSALNSIYSDIFILNKTY